MICANCKASVQTAFCPDCGQKKEIHRITIGHIAHEGFHSVTHADKGFLLLVKELITRPGIIAREYIEGRRKRYFNPLSFLVISSALLAYFGSVTGFMDKLTNNSTGSAGSRRMGAEWAEVMQVAAHSGKWLTLLLIAPLFAFLSWIFFIRKKYNYAENFVLHSFLFGEAALFRLIVFIPLYLLIPEQTGILNLAVYEVAFIIFLTAAYKQFFEQHLVIIIIKVIFIRILFIALFWALIFAYVVTKNLLV